MAQPQIPVASQFTLGVLLASVSVLAVGCREEPEIRHYQVARPEQNREPWRLLGAMIPREAQVWIFRLDGPAVQVADLKPAFERFVKSVRFAEKGQEPITWTLPEGWTREAGEHEFRYATVRIRGKNPLEVTVSSLPRQGDADSIFRNVIRWRDQLGLDPIANSRLRENVTNVEIGGMPVALVDIQGLKPEKRSMMGAARVQDPGRPGRVAPVTYEAPEGWRELPSGGSRVAAFVVRDEDEKAEVTVIPLAGQAGGLLANINRWRGEVDLEPTTEARLAAEVRPVTIDAIEGHYVDLAGPRQRTLAIMLPRGESTWFFKMKGPARLVGKQKAAFEKFAKSIRFTGS